MNVLSMRLAQGKHRCLLHVFISDKWNTESDQPCVCHWCVRLGSFSTGISNMDIKRLCGGSGLFLIHVSSASSAEICQWQWPCKWLICVFVRVAIVDDGHRISKTKITHLFICFLTVFWDTRLLDVSLNSNSRPLGGRDYPKQVPTLREITRRENKLVE